MTTIASTTATPTAVPAAPPSAARISRWAAFSTLSRRRFALSAHTPREILVPLLTPILFADVIAPALAKTLHATGGIGMIVDRESGAQRDLLAAPVPRSLLVFGNLSVALAISSFQVIALIGAAVARGATFATAATGIAWAAAATLGVAMAMHSVAEILACRITKQEEYVGAAPPVALVPWFFAGSFFRITTMPRFLAWFARGLPLTHALALLRYGLVDRRGTGLHDIWGMSNPTVMAALSLAVVVAFAGVMLLLSVRVFSRTVVR